MSIEDESPDALTPAGREGGGARTAHNVRFRDFVHLRRPLTKDPFRESGCRLSIRVGLGGALLRRVGQSASQSASRPIGLRPYISIIHFSATLMARSPPSRGGVYALTSFFSSKGVEGPRPRAGSVGLMASGHGSDSMRGVISFTIAHCNYDPPRRNRNRRRPFGVGGKKRKAKVMRTVSPMQLRTPPVRSWSWRCVGSRCYSLQPSHDHI
ncbi:hypothetical protein C8R43DRAFT_1027498 [Mycena crocata]|nr:hypothetical protein C8R43DRAFT_1027498 [Mycena crocata]